MTDTWKCFVLPEGFRPADDGSLIAFLKSNSKFAVRVDAGKLRRLDTTLIELLLCAAQDWQLRALPFEVSNLSALNGDVMTTLGLTSWHLNWRVAA